MRYWVWLSMIERLVWMGWWRGGCIARGSIGEVRGWSWDRIGIELKFGQFRIFDVLNRSSETSRSNLPPRKRPVSCYD